MRLKFLLLMLLLLTGCEESVDNIIPRFLGVGNPTTIEEIAKLTRDNTVMVENQSDTARSTGFIIYDGFIITTDHSVGNDDYAIVTLEDGSKYKVKVLWRDNIIDLAILSPARNEDGLKVRCSDGVYGEPSIFVGHPNSFTWKLSFGLVSGYLGNGDGFMIIDHAAYEGYSGSAVVSIRDGSVIGVLVQADYLAIPLMHFQYRVPGGSSFAIKSSILCNTLRGFWGKGRSNIFTPPPPKG